MIPSGKSPSFLKLNLPTDRGLLLDRPHLLTRLNNHQANALIAPAGSGKSTLAKQWADAFEGAVCWLSLTQEDNLPRTFWSFALGLIRLAIPSLSEYPTLLLAQEDNQVSERFVDALLAELGALETPLALVVDETQHITHSVLVHSLAHFVAHLPTLTQVVFVGRALDPVIGALVHPVGDITFTMDEAAQYLAHQSEEPPDSATITRIVSATEGWVMGVKLAGIALQGKQAVLERVTSYSAQYLLDEALRHLPPEQLDFILFTCISETLTPDLCNALTGRTDSAAMLETLMNTGLFITRVSDSPPTYRYHQLFRESLLQRDPALLQEAHRRAAAWYAQDGLYRAAAEHAHAIGDRALTVQYIIAASRQSIVDNDPAALLKWLKDFPTDLLDAHPRLRLLAIISLTDLKQDIEEAHSHLKALEGHPNAKHLRGEIALARASLSQSDLSAMVSHLEQAQAHLPQDSLYAYATGLASTAFIILGQPKRGMELMEEEYRVAHAIGSQATILHTLIGRNYLYLAACDLDQVLKSVTEGLVVLQQARHRLGRWANEIERTLRYEAALALLYRGELDAAEQMLQPAFGQIEWIHVSMLALMYSLHASIAVIRRKFAIGDADFRSAEILRGGSLDGPLHLPTQVERVRYILRFPNTEDEARGWLRQIEIEETSFDVSTSIPLMTDHARILVGDIDRALWDLQEFEQQYAAWGQVIMVFMVMGMKVLAYWLKGDEIAARRMLDATIAQTYPRNIVLALSYVHLFPLLRQRIGEYWAVCDDARAEYLRQVILLLGEDAPILPQSPLTDIEWVVARQLLTGRILDDVADDLFMSTNGVRYYMTKMHAKLYTRTRKQLMARLRRMRLDEE